MNRLKETVSRFLRRLKQFCGSKNDETVPDVDPTALAVAQVQEAIMNGEQAIAPADIPRGPATLRKTLHDMPVAQQHTNYGKERHWFDKAQYDARHGIASNTWNRLEAFLSSTDPDQLSALDPTWNRKLEADAYDDRPQPKRVSEEFPKVQNRNSDRLQSEQPSGQTSYAREPEQGSADHGSYDQSSHDQGSPNQRSREQGSAYQPSGDERSPDQRESKSRQSDSWPPPHPLFRSGNLSDSISGVF